jgi:hypothetical protein
MNKKLAMNRPRTLSLMLAALLALGVGLPAQQASALWLFYKFTPIADTGGAFFQHLSGFPVINNNNRVAFSGTLTGGVEGEFTRVDTGGINTMADTGNNEFRFFGIARSINDSGQVLFASQFKPDPAETVLLVGSGNSSTPLIDSGSSFRRFTEFQINNAGVSVFGAQRDSGNPVILIKSLSGNAAVVAEVGSLFSSVDSAPSINNNGLVAFLATRNGVRGIFTRNGASGNIAELTNTTGPIAAFRAVSINDQGSVAFMGVTDAVRPGIFRLENGVLTQINTGSEPFTNDFGGFSINNSGRVAYEGRSAPIASTVFVGPNVFRRRVVGFGDTLFGRTVTHALINRDSLNDQNQIAVTLAFADGTTMVARVDQVALPFNELVFATAALQISTGAGSGAGAGTTIRNPRGRGELSFDVRFLNDTGNLEIRLDDQVVKTIPAADVGMESRMQVPLDFASLYKGRAAPGLLTLSFALIGKPGFAAQIDNVVIPGLFSDQLDEDSSSNWRVDSSKGGAAAVVDTTRFPAKIDVQPGKSPNVVNRGGAVAVAILSSAGLDAPEEIDRATIRLAHAPPRMTRDKQAVERAACEKRDVDEDKLADLVCEIQAERLAANDGEVTLVLEASTISAMPIRGTDSARIEGKGKPRPVAAAGN